MNYPDAPEMITSGGSANALSIAKHIKSLIAEGKLSSGDVLKGAPRLAALYGVDARSMRTALATLLGEGVLVHHGRSRWFRVA